MIDQIADNNATLPPQASTLGPRLDATFLIAVNQRMMQYHEKCMYDRSVQLRLTLFRGGIFKDLRWTGQEVDYIEGHDDALRDCAEATIFGAPPSKCGPAYATDRPGAESSRGFESAPPPPGVDDPTRQRAIESVLKKVVDQTPGTSTSTDPGTWNLNCGGVLIATIPRSNLPAQSTTGLSAPHLTTINGTRELRQMLQQIQPRNEAEAKEKAEMLRVTVERKEGARELAEMHRGWLERWARDPATVPVALREVMERERRGLLYRFDLERDVDQAEKRLRRGAGR